MTKETREVNVTEPKIGKSDGGKKRGKYIQRKQNFMRDLKKKKERIGGKKYSGVFFLVFLIRTMKMTL